MKYILVVISCSDCGSKVAVMAFHLLPSEQERKDLIDSIGGLSCITQKLFRQTEGGNYELIEEV